MIVFERKTIVRARKMHDCFNCGRSIAIGQDTLEFFAVVPERGGRIYGHACGTCGFLWDKTVIPYRFI